MPPQDEWAPSLFCDIPPPSDGTGVGGISLMPLLEQHLQNDPEVSAGSTAPGA